jgi:hypothetical protein
MARVVALLYLAACGSPSASPGAFTVVIDRVDYASSPPAIDTDVDVRDDTYVTVGDETHVDNDTGIGAGVGACAAPAPTFVGGGPLADLRVLDVTLCLHASGVSRAIVHAYQIDLDQVAVCGTTVELDVHGFAADPLGAWWSLWTPDAEADGCAAGVLPGTWMVSGTALVEGDGLRFDHVDIDDVGGGWLRAHATRLEVTR